MYDPKSYQLLVICYLEFLMTEDFNSFTIFEKKSFGQKILYPKI